jgi:hypothetical protein
MTVTGVTAVTGGGRKHEPKDQRLPVMMTADDVDAIGEGTAGHLL